MIEVFGALCMYCAYENMYDQNAVYFYKIKRLNN